MINTNNIASINANVTMLNNSANNVANVNTDGFIPTQTDIVNQGNSIVANSKQADDNGSERSQTDLAKEMVNQILASDAISVNVTAIKTQDEMIGTILDIKS